MTERIARDHLAARKSCRSLVNPILLTSSSPRRQTDKWRKRGHQILIVKGMLGCVCVDVQVSVHLHQPSVGADNLILCADQTWPIMN